MDRHEWDRMIVAAQNALKESTGKTHLVGAAMMDERGSMHVGANQEVYNHRSTLHAEDVALSHLKMSGAKFIRAVVCVAVDTFQPRNVYLEDPCGSCRDLIHQHSDKENPAHVLWPWYSAKSIESLLPFHERPSISDL